MLPEFGHNLLLSFAAIQLGIVLGMLAYIVASRGED